MGAHGVCSNTRALAVCAFHTAGLAGWPGFTLDARNGQYRASMVELNAAAAGPLKRRITSHTQSPPCARFGAILNYNTFAPGEKRRGSHTPQ